MAEIDSGLMRLASAYSIATEFWDWKGAHVDIPAETLVATLAAIDVDASTPEKVTEALAERDLEPWLHALPPVVVTEQGQAARFDVHVSAGSPAEVWIRCENGTRAEARQVDNDVPDREVMGHRIGRATFELPGTLALGYHTIVLRSGVSTHETTLIVTPHFVGLPARLGDDRVWGLMTQLYSLTSKGSWCFGDLLDLADLAVWAKTQHGADYILINPLHAAEPVPPMEPSPYLPSSRRYVNPIYIRPEAVHEYGGLSDRRRRRIAEARRNLAKALADEASVRRDDVWAAKRQALEQVFLAPRRVPREWAMEQFFAEEGEPLRLWATYCALAEAYGPNWHEWEPELRDPGSPAVVSFAQQHARDVRFHMWLQWVAESQLSDAQYRAKEIGMRIGIVADLAVGVSKDGAETWMMGGVFGRGVTVGAPPDAYNQAGQEWGQPPWRPDKLEAAAYEPYRSMVRSILRHSGGIRADHILGLFRLWWVPDGAGPRAGTYIRYNHEAMVGILALEARRADAVVIGEDLGTVEPWVRTYLKERGILGTSVLWFEYTDDGEVRAPDAWRELCMGSVTTHDLPPTAGYLAHDHVALRHSLGLLTESLADEIARDVAEQGAIVHMLEDRGHLAEGERDPHAILLALHRYLTETRARVLCVALTDAVGERRTQNQPGTIDEYPNWRVPLADSTGRRLTLEDIYDLPTVGELSSIMNA
ncbi:MAG: 4-alpha-glucanotransferase [Propionibacteriaceae bacterium]|jgi:4-alpha-glucanotransferase|nr:4-alpha-glucanotransferase [Propionibacteriaceae bacterium]